MARGPMTPATKAMLQTRRSQRTPDQKKRLADRAAARQTEAYLRALLGTKKGREDLFMMAKGNRAGELSRSVSPNARLFKHGGMKKTASRMTRASAKKYAKKIQPRRGGPLTSLGKLYHLQEVPKTKRAREKKIATFMSPSRM